MRCAGSPEVSVLGDREGLANDCDLDSLADLEALLPDAVIFAVVEWIRDSPSVTVVGGVTGGVVCHLPS